MGVFSYASLTWTCAHYKDAKWHNWLDFFPKMCQNTLTLKVWLSVLCMLVWSVCHP